MEKEEIIRGLKAGRVLNCDRRDEPLLPWLLEHPNVENSGVIQLDEQSSVIKFWWKKEAVKPECPVCKSTTFTVHPGVVTTLVGYSPVIIDGVEHDHDDNCRKSAACCENGHDFVVRRRNRCSKCEWVGKEKCFCDTPLTVVI